MDVEKRIIDSGKKLNVLYDIGTQIHEELKKKGCDAYYFPSFEEIETFCLDKCQKGDVLITMGAGDVVNIGEHLLGK